MKKIVSKFWRIPKQEVTAADIKWILLDTHQELYLSPYVQIKSLDDISKDTVRDRLTTSQYFDSIKGAILVSSSCHWNSLLGIEE